MLEQGSAQQEKRSLKQIIIYLAVGGGTALLELIIFQVLYLLIGLDVAVSNVIAVFVATLTNFALNGTVTFKTSTNMLRSIILYCLLFAFNTAFSTTVIAYAVSLGCPSLVIKLITMVCIVLWNFVLYKKVVFR